MFNPTSQKELKELLQSAQVDKTAYTPEKYLYVIYVRKSTDETSKQIRSIDDQIKECVDFADKNGLKWKDIIDEAESAKEPDIRPKFKQMLVDINTGKYNGIIAWHPDRCARNMREAGEIIDLVDKNIIKDLKFVSFTFNNDPSGKLLLGITFALSKEYSDKLSINVKRGNHHSLNEGKYVGGISKHGYIKDVNGFLQPDGNNFALLKQGFRMRLEHKTLEEIVDFLKENKYFHRNRIGAKEYYAMNKQKVQSIMIDPVYTGVLQYGENTVTLTDYYPFMVMVSVGDFMKINKLSKDSDILKLARSYKKGDEVKANALREEVICASCEEITTACVTLKKGLKDGSTGYYYFRCDTVDCVRYGKSTRLKVIRDYVCELFTKKPFSSKESYEHYAKEIKRVNVERIVMTKEKLLSLRIEKLKAQEKIEKTKDLLLSKEEESIKKYYRGDIEKAEKRIAEIEESELQTRKVYESDKVSILTQEKFIELTKNIPKILVSIKTSEELGYFLEKMFLNFTVDSKNVYKSTFKPPFDSLADQKVLNGAQERT